MWQDAAFQLAEVYGIPLEGEDKFLRSHDPLKRIATPEEVADLVVFLAMTPGGGAITGQGLCMATTTCLESQVERGLQTLAPENLR
jgi:NAD(P)-dependent dehydrogenase (short-subunit alcohol dehydrogenase family)